MKHLYFRLFVWISRLRGVPVPRDVNRYALVVSGKKPFHDWLRNVPHRRMSLTEARAWKKVYLLSNDIVPEAGNLQAGSALQFMLLDFFSDFLDSGEAMPEIEADRLLQWFDFQQIDWVVDVSSRRLDARTYSFE